MQASRPLLKIRKDGELLEPLIKEIKSSNSLKLNRIFTEEEYSEKEIKEELRNKIIKKLIALLSTFFCNYCFFLDFVY